MFQERMSAEDESSSNLRALEGKHQVFFSIL